MTREEGGCDGLPFRQPLGLWQLGDAFDGRALGADVPDRECAQAGDPARRRIHVVCSFRGPGRHATRRPLRGNGTVVQDREAILGKT